MIFLILLSTAIGHARPMSEMHGDCSNYELNISAELKTWDAPKAPLAAADTSKKLQSPIAQGILYEISLVPEAKVKFLAKPEKSKPDGDKLSGGLARVQIHEAGTYRVSIGQKVWVDVLDEKSQIVESKSFEMQTKCPKIFKVVEYELKKGLFTLQFSGSQTNLVKVLLSRKL